VHEVDLLDHDGLRALVSSTQPTQIHHLGGMSSVGRSWEEPVRTVQVTGLSTVVLLESALELQERIGRAVHFVLASSAEIFGEPSVTPQDESTPVRPVSPYGSAKALAHASVGVYRRRGLPASSLILYNHESPRRPPSFVTRKITQGVARIVREGEGVLTLGNLDARRDWGWAPDYVDAMMRAAHGPADDYVIATGVDHSVRDFVATAFESAGMTDWEAHVAIDPDLFRPSDPAVLVGDATHARKVLDWRPTRTFESVIEEMVRADVEQVKPSAS